jgi:hypothetical protein
MTEKKRNYAKEYKDFHGLPSQIEKRAERNAARSEMGLKVGDKREVHHKVPLSEGGSNSKRNLVITSRAVNRRKGAGKK